MIYLDNAATTKAHSEVLDSFVKVNQSLYFNPNSPHVAGLQAEKILDQARIQIKQLLSLSEQMNIIFTSGATESNNIALKGIAYSKKEFANEIITSVIEHPSVLEVVRNLEQDGFKVKYVDITPEGKIDMQHFKSLMNDRVGLVTCMYVNNVMGQIQPIEEIINILKDYPKTHLHVDAVQALGKIDIVTEGINSLSLSGHKFNGLKGQGLLIIDNLNNLSPTIHGGGQEFGIRSGTVNLPMDVSLVKAIKLAITELEERKKKLLKLNHDLRQFFKNYRGIYINSPKDAAPHILNIAFPGVKGEVLVNAFSKEDIMVSTTSACSSKRGKLNEVLLAMNISEKRIEGSIRISLGDLTSNEDIELFQKKFANIYEQIKELLRT